MAAAADRWPEPEPNPLASAAAGDAEQLLLNKESLNGNRPFISYARTPSLGTAGSPTPQGASALEDSEARLGGGGTGEDLPAGASDAHSTEATATGSPGPPNGDAAADDRLGSGEFSEPAAGDARLRDSQEPGENGLGPRVGASAAEPAGGSSDPSDGVPGGRSPAPCNGSGADEESTADHHGHPGLVTDLIATQDPAQAYRQGAVMEVDTDVPGVGESTALWGTMADLSAGTYDPPLPDGQAAGAHFADGLELAADPDGLAHYQPAGGDYEAAESGDGVPPYPADFEKYWKIVEDNPYDFTGWTYVLQYVEQENHIWAVRRTFDSFFTRYPYCYGYWKKYADIEKRLGFTKEAEEVYQRGLQSIPLSVDLWVHYITFLQEILEPASPDTSVKLRSVFEMALAAAGTDFRSDRLWDLYVTWEKEQGNLKAVTAIYDRLLSIPTQLYSHHFEKFKEHVQSYSPKDILSTDEFLRLRSEVVTSLAAAEGDSDEGPPGDDPPPGVGTTDQEKADTEMGRIRAHLEATRQEMYLLNEEEVSKRWHFEEAIKRPYFHVKPLERVQLKNWRDYLDFEIASGTNERVLVLFERCVIACALYEDFWIKYAKYLENHSVEAVRNVFQRACMVHLPKKPTLHLLWAAFEEQQGEFKEAQRILRSFQAVMPGLAMVLLRRVSLERRCGNTDEAEALLREAIEQHQDTPLASFFAIKLSRQLLKVQRNLAKARKVLLEAIDRDKDNVKLYLNLLELEFSCDVRANESNILGCFDQVLAGSLPLEIKIVFSQRRVEFLEDFGSSVRSLLQAYDEHQKLLKQNASKKRAAENGTEEPDEKRARAEDGTPVVAATSAAALTSGDAVGSQAAYSYSAWYQPYASYGYQSPWNYNQYYPHS